MLVGVRAHPRGALALGLVDRLADASDPQHAGELIEERVGGRGDERKVEVAVGLEAGVHAAQPAALARQRRASGGVHASFAANRDFHLALVAASGNQFLEQLAQVLWVARIGEAIYEAQAETPERMRLDTDEHEAILAAVERGSARQAETLTRRHVAAAIKRSPL